MRNLALAVCFLALSCSVVPSPDRAAALRDVAACMVQVDVSTSEGDGYGSGSVIWCEPRDGRFVVLILTAQHVAEAGPDVHISVGGVPARLVASHAADAAIIEIIVDRPMRTVPIAIRNVQIGDTIFSFGFSGGARELWITEGVASAPNRGGSAAPGDSGGAVINERGELVGIVVAVDMFGFGIPVVHHCTFVDIQSIRGWVDAVLQPTR